MHPPPQEEHRGIFLLFFSSAGGRGGDKYYKLLAQRTGRQSGILINTPKNTTFEPNTNLLYNLLLIGFDRPAVHHDAMKSTVLCAKKKKNIISTRSRSFSPGDSFDSAKASREIVDGALMGLDGSPIKDDDLASYSSSFSEKALEAEIAEDEEEEGDVGEDDEEEDGEEAYEYDMVAVPDDVDFEEEGGEEAGGEEGEAPLEEESGAGGEEGGAPPEEESGGFLSGLFGVAAAPAPEDPEPPKDEEAGGEEAGGEEEGGEEEGGEEEAVGDAEA